MKARLEQKAWETKSWLLESGVHRDSLLFHSGLTCYLGDLNVYAVFYHITLPMLN